MSKQSFQHIEDSQRFDFIDLLRACAVILVLFRHIPRPSDSIISQSPYFSFLINYLIQIGWVGVDLFFVISGFLIGRLIFKEIQLTESFNLWRFLVRRGFKIYPLYYLLILLTGFLLTLSSSVSNLPWSALIGEVLFIQNYYNHFWSHTWSLAVEEHFYLILSTLIFILLKVSKNFNRAIIITIAILTTIVAIGRIFFIIFNPNTHWTKVLLLTHFRIDALFCGVLVGYCYVVKQALFWKINLELKKISIILFTMPFMVVSFYSLEKDSFILGPGLSIIYICFSLYLLASFPTTRSNMSPSIIRNGFEEVGRSSYAIYLYHLLISHVIFNAVGEIKLSPVILYICQVIIYIAVSIILGILLTRTIERPLLNLRDKYVP